MAGVDLLANYRNNHVSNINPTQEVVVKQFDEVTKKSTNFTTTNYRTAVRLNRHRSELVPVNLARRLLRTKRTLVLPAHVNITLISSSYDVVHS